MVRHNRAAAFDAAWRAPTADVAGWAALAGDPNDPRAVAHRARTLQAAWRPGIADRVEFLTGRCRGKHVLDIGCVAHDEARLGGDDWLHAHLARAAATCVGVDILEAGVAAVNAAGYDAVAHDLTGGLGPLAARGPFDVIVAGQLGIVWENVDHVSYLFPSGIAELAARRGLVLAEAATVGDRARPGRSTMQKLKRTVRGSHWRNVGFATDADPGPRAVDAGAAGRVLRRLVRPRRRFLGETFVYVVKRHVGPGPSSA